MKKIFTLIGIMTVIFSVYFMLLVVDKSNYIDESRISDFSLSKQINLKHLKNVLRKVMFVYKLEHLIIIPLVILIAKLK